jgi:hypothetical protein
MDYQKLAELTTNSQNIELEKINRKRLSYDNIIETKEFKLSGHRLFTAKTNSIYDAIANFSIVGDWEVAILLVENDGNFVAVDKIHKSSGQNVFDALNNSSFIPCDVTIRILGDSYLIKYDIVDYTPFPINDKYFIRNQIYGLYNINLLGVNKLTLQFNDIIEKIYLITKFPVDNVLLVVNDIEFNFTKINEMKWEISFYNSYINFNRIDKKFIICENLSDSNELELFATSHHIATVSQNSFKVN